MKFEWLNKQGVKSDEGFVVQCVSRDAYEYRERDHILRLEGESAFGNLEGASFGFHFYPDWKTRCWLPPHSNEIIVDEHRKKIVRNIEAAFEFMDGRALFGGLRSVT